jgi:hypothetical protein
VLTKLHHPDEDRVVTGHNQQALQAYKRVGMEINLHTFFFSELDRGKCYCTTAVSCKHSTPSYFISTKLSDLHMGHYISV